MEKLKRSLSFRKKKDHVPECSKPHQWQEDERKVREGTCSFQVRYLGCIEVFESRGMQVCEEAVKAMKARNSRSVWSRMSLRRKSKRKKDKDKAGDLEGGDTEGGGIEEEQCKGKYQRAILYVSGDALRVVDEISKGLIVDQTIEKVSFCAPDRNHEKGFAYICRDGTTRRWMCHGFLALKESGERLSHAVGCAFAICLEKKQKREKEAVQVQYNDKGTSFSRTGSFRQATLTERLADPQSTQIADPIPQRQTANPFAVQRPHATQDMLVRQGSFRGFQKLSETSPFKRQLSLRLNDLPSTLERRSEEPHANGIGHNGPAASPIPEASPSKENPDSIAEMCQQLTQGLTALTSDEPFANAPGSLNMSQASNNSTPTPAPAPAPTPPTQSAMVHASPQHGTTPLPIVTGYTTTVQGRSIALPDPIRQNNPWGAVLPPGHAAQPAPPAAVPPQHRKPSEAELWLHSTASVVASPKPAEPAYPAMTNGSSYASPYALPPGALPPPPPPQRAPQLAHLRSHSIDTADMWSGQRGPSLRELATRPEVAQFQSQQGSSPWAPPQPAPAPAFSPAPDPFDAAWAAKGGGNTNPFQPKDNVTKTFEVKL